MSIGSLTLTAYFSLDQIADQLDQMSQGSTHAVELPDHDHIAGAQLTQHLIERRNYGELNVLARHRVGLDRITPHWDDVLRLVGSLNSAASQP